RCAWRLENFSWRSITPAKVKAGHSSHREFRWPRVTVPGGGRLLRAALAAARDPSRSAGELEASLADHVALLTVSNTQQFDGKPILIAHMWAEPIPAPAHAHLDPLAPTWGGSQMSLPIQLDRADQSLATTRPHRGPGTTCCILDTTCDERSC